ncbi:alpha/beta fold hydrolase [Luteibacter pinisoli]|uniref:alpha/beta fold hydrolase n=1 Tax=Luteibacter pinisoli TaxID=2589080 RepID=UPI001476A95F|nr:alpha/beta fold hydrolase [Luteibacter pinisoli]
MTPHPKILASVMLAAFAIVPAARAQAVQPARIQWTTCEEAVADALRPLLSVRLQCGTMDAPIDHLHPDAGNTKVGLVRVLAEDQGAVAGSFFFNFGGPGGNPRSILPVIAAMWSKQEADDPISGYQKTLSRHYDLVAVVPRGLAGGDTLDCFEHYEATPFIDLASDQGDFNWRSTMENAKALAYACASNPLTPYINTEQHVYDMELARLSLGESALNFIGFSYGTWVASWYASLFPDHVGRMLLDSTMDVTGSFDDADEASLAERHRDFLRLAVRPALSRPRLYGMGDEEEGVLRRVRNMPPRARTAWVGRMGNPEALTAALTMSDWVAAVPFTTSRELHKRVNDHTFSTDATIDRDVRAAAHQLASALGDAREDTPEGPDPERYSVLLAVRCNDTPWERSPGYWWAMARSRVQRYPAGASNEMFGALVCSHWDDRRTRRPSLEPMHTAPPFLMIQAQHDTATPLPSAIHVFNTFGNANLVVASHMTGHAILGSTRTPCVEQAAGRYLLHGELPERRFVSCEHVPVATPRADGPVNPLSVDGLRATLETLLRDS